LAGYISLSVVTTITAIGLFAVLAIMAFVICRKIYHHRKKKKSGLYAVHFEYLYYGYFCESRHGLCTDIWDCYAWIIQVWSCIHCVIIKFCCRICRNSIKCGSTL
jgi:hypothetical protein